MEKKLKKTLKMVLLLTIFLTTVCFLSEHMDREVRMIKRNNYGEGSRKETFELTIEDELLEKPIEVEVPEREYTPEELKKVFKEVMDQVEKLVLDKNKSADHVENDLNFITEIPGYPITITWESDQYHVIDSAGVVHQEELTEEGTPVEIKGTLSYGKESCIYIMNVMVYPKTLTEKEKMVHQILEKISKEENTKRSKEYLQLPDRINGKEITWKKKAENKSPVIFVLGILSMILLVFRDQEQKEKQKKDRKRQMEIDYPSIVSQLAMLVESGMNVKNAWQKIVYSYEEDKRKTKERYAYEEMKYTLQEMKGGKTESECYEDFGKRCQIPVYMKLGSILSQNLRKGMKGLSKLLSEEAEEAFTMRKLQAVKTGEEAGTKLLFPMSLMLVIVLIIVMVPAFLSLSV